MIHILRKRVAATVRFASNPADQTIERSAIKDSPNF
jgi:hypothetical protein